MKPNNKNNQKEKILMGMFSSFLLGFGIMGICLSISNNIWTIISAIALTIAIITIKFEILLENETK